MDIKSAIAQVAQGHDLTRDQMRLIIKQLMEGEATDAQIGAFLAALTIKGETVEEILGAVLTMRDLSLKVKPKASHVTDCVGTGGDGAKIFNVSTASALVASAAGVVMAKHGNRAATGNSGSADLLEQAGVNIQLSADEVAECIDRCGIGFLFAPTHHSAIKHVIGPRKEIGLRSVFNLLGPMTNPANPSSMLVGVFDRKWVSPVAQVLMALGCGHVMVVYSEDGMDEISIAAKTYVAEAKDGQVTEYTVTPEQLGFKRQPIDSLVVADSAQSLAIIQAALSGRTGAASNMIALNAGATIYVAGKADSLQSGVTMAQAELKKASGLDQLKKLVAISNSFNRV